MGLFSQSSKFTSIAILFTLATFHLATTAHAQDRPTLLFNDLGEAVHNYTKIVKSWPRNQRFNPPKRIQFSQTEVFTIHEVLGQGNQNVLLDMGKGKCLVILKTAPPPGQTENSITRFMRGHSLLEAEGVPTPKTYPQESSPTGKYAVVEKIEVQFTLDEFLGHLSRYSAKEKKRLKKAFQDFSRSVAEFSSIGDFHLGQVAWDGDKWVLLDWEDGHRLRRDPGLHTQNIFSELREHMFLVDTQHPVGNHDSYYEAEAFLQGASDTVKRHRRRCDLRKKVLRFLSWRNR